MLGITVITINLNSESDLSRTIDSVISQTYPNVEHIIIDGGSTDGSLDLIKGNTAFISNWVSEKDDGRYDAMNKGIELSTGDYLIFLNAGDTFYSEKSLDLFYNNHDNCDLIYGDLEIKTEPPYIKQYPDSLSFGYFLRDTLPHPATFIKKTVFNTCGRYSTDMLITSDWAFFLKAICLNNISYKHIDYTISSFDVNGISSKASNGKIIDTEKCIFLNSNFPAFHDEYVELMQIKERYYHLKNSRLRKYLSYFFNQLKI